MIKNIVIVGGGTAGWATAHQFINKTNPNNTKITVIAAEEIPIIGVGESTTGIFNDLINLPNNKTGINEKDFLKQTESTFKIGIKHSDWHTIGKFFYSPLGDNYYNDNRFPHPDYDNFRVYHVAEKLEHNKTFQSRLMLENKLHFKNNKSIYGPYNVEGVHIPVAYHLDTYKVGKYLKEKAIVLSNVKYINDQVIDFKQDENGFVKSLKTKTGKSIKGDLFIDCTGFARVLIDKVEDNKWVSYENNLLVDSALNFNYEYDKDEEIKNYTHVWAQKYGWLWEIPTQTRMGCGYVFSSKFTNFDKAYDEISKVLRHRKIKIQKEIKFNAGRLEKFWCKNVLSTGLSSAFVEPLEATSILATVMQITHFIENYFKSSMNLKCDLFQQQYNYEITQLWDSIRDFIVFHYITPRKDTDFWIESSKRDRFSPRLNRLLEMWKYRMPRVLDYVNDKGNNFYTIGNTLWYQVGIGMKLFNAKVAKQELKDYSLYDLTKEQYKNICQQVNKILPECIKTNEYYKSL
jgi:flavin-dependent dehydrogenase